MGLRSGAVFGENMINPPRLTAETGAGAPFFFYTSAKRKSAADQVVGKRYLGCGFSVNSRGWLATCRHLFDGMSPDEEFVVGHGTTNQCFFPQDVRLHPSLDIAMVRIDQPWATIPAFKRPLMMGEHAAAFGLTFSKKAGAMLHVNPKFLAGHVSCTVSVNDSGYLTNLPFYELSFPALSGFSGCAILHLEDGYYTLAGMIFGNVRSEIIESSKSEVVDGNLHFSERVSRIWEGAAAHTIATLLTSFKDLSIDVEW